MLKQRMGLCPPSSFMSSTVFKNSESGQRRPQKVCANAQLSWVFTVRICLNGLFSLDVAGFIVCSISGHFLRVLFLYPLLDNLRHCNGVAECTERCQSLQNALTCFGQYPLVQIKNCVISLLLKHRGL